ncbi:MAG: protein rep, partial [Clostridium sp.]|uniref:protein rep n=1 Tax=Clostridium sp. TaxID=1506 RepID=UPI003EE6E09E
CKVLDISKFIYEFKKYYTELIPQGYKAYMLTLTVPSIPGEDLRATIDKLNKTFRKMIYKFTYDDSKGYSDRYFKVDGGIKVLEITYNANKGFHPHFHCVLLIRDDISPNLLLKDIEGKWSNKRQSYNMKSHIDIQMGKIWSMLWYGDNFKNIDKLVYDPKAKFYEKNKKVLEVDFVPLDEKGIYEVFKYTFKDSDIENYYVFKTLVQALENKRVRQGFGLLLNMKCENVDEGEKQELNLEIKENPVSLLTYEINELITTYRDYKKISRFNAKLIE